MKTVLQQEIERQKKIVEAEHEKDQLNLIVLARAGEAIKLLESLLPASEQELKEAYQARIDMTVSGDYVSADDWFRNEFGEG